MSTLKAQFSDAEARVLLSGLFDDMRDLETLGGGEASQAFGFASEGRSLILRVNHQFSYEREAGLCRQLASSPVPVPQIISTGRAGEQHWSISERAPGGVLDTLDLTQLIDLRGDLVQTLDAIHATPVDGTTGFGWLTESGNAAHPTWRAFLETDGLYGTFVNWDEALPQATTRQRHLVESAWDMCREMFDTCPEQRAMLHGDYTYDNLLTDGKQVTGVIDWNNCLYGDPLWDVAWIDIWTPGLEFAPAWFRIYPTDHGDARILCYQLIFASSAIGFYIQTRQPAKTPWIEDQLKTRLELAHASRQ